MESNHNNGIPPANAFGMVKPVGTKALEAWMDIKLFEKHHITRINDKGEIRFHIGDVLYEYQVRDEEKLFRYKNGRIIYRYSKEDLSVVYIYNYMNDDFIDKVYPKEEWDKNNKGALGRHKKLVSNVIRYVDRKKAEDEAILTGKAIEKPQEISADDARIEKMMAIYKTTNKQN